jgi:ribosome-associated toxin RatA of RatAB toxin-antitoxin module
MKTRAMEIDCSADKVLKTLLDFENYPNWSGFKSAKVIESNSQLGASTVEFEIVTSGITDKLTLGIASSNNNVVWKLRQSEHLSELSGEFRISALSESSCLVEYNLVVNFKNPIFNLMKKNIEDQMTQKVLQRLADAAKTA